MINDDNPDKNLSLNILLDADALFNYTVMHQLDGNMSRQQAMKIYKLRDCEYWYDRSQRCWYAARILSPQGDLGASINEYTKREIIRSIESDMVPKGYTAWVISREFLQWK